MRLLHDGFLSVRKPSHPQWPSSRGPNQTRQNDTGNKEILMTTMAGGDPSARSIGDDVQPGFEIGYQHEIGTHGKWRYGVEGAFNFMNLCLSEAYAYNGAGLQYNFPYTFNGVSGNNPPATYQGTYDFNFGGPNFEISANPTAGSPTPVTLAAAGQNKFSADIWGFRLGPYVEYPLGGRGKVILTGGFAFALIDSRASWSQSLSVNSGAPTAYSGSGSKTGVAYGYYLGANLAYKVSKRWSAIAGVQWQDLSTFDYVVGSQPASREVQLDMSGSIYLLLGLSYSF
jgi:hypothetical protein